MDLVRFTITRHSAKHCLPTRIITHALSPHRSPLLKSLADPRRRARRALDLLEGLEHLPPVALLRLLEQPSAEFQDALLTLLRAMLDLLHLSDARVCALAVRDAVHLLSRLPSPQGSPPPSRLHAFAEFAGSVAGPTRAVEFELGSAERVAWLEGGLLRLGADVHASSPQLAGGAVFDSHGIGSPANAAITGRCTVGEDIIAAATNGAACDAAGGTWTTVTGADSQSSAGTGFETAVSFRVLR